MTRERASLIGPIGLIAALAFGSTTAFGRTYETLSNSLGQVTVNTADGSQNQPGVLVLPAYGMEVTDSMNTGGQPSPDLNWAKAVSDGQ